VHQVAVTGGLSGLFRAMLAFVAVGRGANSRRQGVWCRGGIFSSGALPPLESRLPPRQARRCGVLVWRDRGTPRVLWACRSSLSLGVRRLKGGQLCDTTRLASPTRRLQLTTRRARCASDHWVATVVAVDARFSHPQPPTVVGKALLRRMKARYRRRGGRRRHRWQLASGASVTGSSGRYAIARAVGGAADMRSTGRARLAENIGKRQGIVCRVPLACMLEDLPPHVLVRQLANISFPAMSPCSVLCVCVSSRFLIVSYLGTAVRCPHNVFC